MSVHVAGASPSSFYVGGRRAVVLVKGGAVVWRGEPVYRLATAAADEPRVDWRLVGGVWTRGLLVEPAATNVAPAGRSFDLADAAVTLTGVGLDLAPCAVIEDADDTTRALARADVVVTNDGQTRAVSIYVAVEEEDRFPQFRFDDGASGGRAWVNMNARTGSYSVSNVVGGWSAWLEPGPEGWRRLVCRAVNPTQGILRVWCYPATGTLTTTEVSAVGSVRVDGLQVEIGTQASSVLLTSGATKSRAADIVSRDLAAGEVVLQWLDAQGAAQSSTVQHTGGTFTLPAGPRRAYTSVKLDGAEQLDLDDLSAWTIERASEGTYTVQIGGE